MPLMLKGAVNVIHTWGPRGNELCEIFVGRGGAYAVGSH